jgi:hypothetical protein
MDDRCDECGFVYDEHAAARTPQAIADGVAELVSLLTGTRAGLGSRRMPAVWSPLEYGCHVRDVLLVQRERVLLARREVRPVCVPIGRDERVDHDGYAEQEPAAVARQLVEAATLFANVLRRLDDTAWGRTVVYQYPEPAERTLRWVAVHTLHEIHHHTLDIRRQLNHR